MVDIASKEYKMISYVTSIPQVSRRILDDRTSYHLYAALRRFSARWKPILFLLIYITNTIARVSILS